MDGERMTIYANSLGKPVKALRSFRLYKESDCYSLWHISREVIWDADYNFTMGKRLVAVQAGYVYRLENFELAVEQAEDELVYLSDESMRGFEA